MIGPTIPELTEALSDLPNIERTLIYAWDDERIRDAVKATGRRKLVFGAIGTNVCLAQATIGAAADGYEAYAAIDLSGTSNELLRAAAIAQMTQAGVGITSGPAAIFQILHDNANPSPKTSTPPWDRRSPQRHRHTRANRSRPDTCGAPRPSDTGMWFQRRQALKPHRL